MTQKHDGVLIVDKPLGPTSHDVVSKARKARQTRAVGHAGTLDPMATGVLVLGINRGTKLVPWLTAADKTYETTIRLGVATHSLDAQGDVTEEKPVPVLTIDQVREAARSFVGTHAQRAPAVSAIKVDGKRLHERVRKGEKVEAPLRSVVLHEVDILSVGEGEIRARLVCGKGFYVRSFGRDLAEMLGTVGHLSALRRTASGAFDISEAVSLEGMAAAIPLTLAEAATRLMPVVEVNETGATDAKHGRRIGPEGLVGEMPALDAEDVAGLVREGVLLAVVRAEDGRLRVVRGFAG